MERSELLKELKSMIGEYLTDTDKLKLANITEDSDLLKDINMDSIDMIDVVIKVENKYGIVIKNETIAGLNTAGKWLDLIEDALIEKEQP